jgi:hypothetical protein
MCLLLEYFFFEIICCNMTSGRIAVVTPLEFDESKLGICQVALPSNGILQLSYFQPCKYVLMQAQKHCNRSSIGNIATAAALDTTTP